MYKNKTSKKFFFSFLTTLCLSSCSYFDNSSDYSSQDFNTDPYEYKQAKIAADAKLPKYLAENIDREVSYPIPDDKTKLNGSLDINPVPPSLEGKIKTYG